MRRCWLTRGCGTANASTSSWTQRVDSRSCSTIAIRTGAASARSKSPAVSSTSRGGRSGSGAPRSWSCTSEPDKVEIVFIMGSEYMRDRACQRCQDCRYASPVASIIDTVANLAKRRGLVYQSGEIYGGTKSAWDYGPLGVELKENIKRQWWRSVVTGRDDVVGLDSSIILPRQVWVASGHVEVFHDPLVESLITHKRYRADHLIEAYEAKHGHPPAHGLADIRDPAPGEPDQWTEPREFSMMLKTYLGPIETEEGLHYLRPGTAQGFFVNIANVVTTSRCKPPFGIGQMGKSFRNEITPGNFIFRTREFEQMEMEYFVEPGTDEELHQYWIDERTRWYTDLGIDRDNLRHFEHPQEKLSHYSKRTVDIEYRFEFDGLEWGELEGIANRGDFDLNTHANSSGVDLSYFDQATSSRFRPFVIEPAAGVGRPLMAFLLDAYREDQAPNAKGGVDRRVVLSLDRRLAPVK